MSHFLEALKNGIPEAQQKFVAAQQKLAAMTAEFQAAQQRLNAAQAEYQLAAQEFQAFQTLVNMHTRKQQAAAGTPPAATIVRTVPVNPALPANSTVNQHAPTPQSATDDNKSDGNKTQAVRELLRQHQTGMTPAEIWKQLETKLSNRAYLYSVLKRLRDKGDARAKRGKYYLNLKLEENQAQTTVQ
jgi:hypothetical protein